MEKVEWRRGVLEELTEERNARLQSKAREWWSEVHAAADQVVLSAIVDGRLSFRQALATEAEHFWKE